MTTNADEWIECDAPHCPARATAHVTLVTGTLHFCAHHMAAYAPQIARTVAARAVADAKAADAVEVA